MARTRMVRTYPAHTLNTSLSVATVIYKDNAGLPVDRSLLADRLGASVKSSRFTTLLAASEQYGLTLGNYNSDNISLTDLGNRIMNPFDSDSLKAALRSAAYTPPKFNDLFELIGGQEIPEKKFLENLVIKNLQINNIQVGEYISIFLDNYKYSDGQTVNNIKPTTKNESVNSFSDVPIESTITSTSRKIMILSKTGNDILATEIKDFLHVMNIPCQLIGFYKNPMELAQEISVAEVALSIVVLDFEIVNQLKDLSTVCYALGLANVASPRKVLVVMNSDLVGFIPEKFLKDLTVVNSNHSSDVKSTIVISLFELGVVSLSMA